jgi:hypothetical protein
MLLASLLLLAFLVLLALPMWLSSLLLMAFLLFVAGVLAVASVPTDHSIPIVVGVCTVHTELYNETYCIRLLDNGYPSVIFFFYRTEFRISD